MAGFGRTRTSTRRKLYAINFTPSVLLESASIGAAVGTATVTGGRGASVTTFSLPASDGGNFAINSTTGAVTVAASLSGLIGNRTITIRATDGFDTADGTFLVAVTANPNQSPTAITFLSALTIAEDAVDGVVVADFEVTDADSDTVEVTTDNPKFEIVQTGPKTYQLALSAAGEGNLAEGVGEDNTLSADDTESTPYTDDFTVTITAPSATLTLVATQTIVNDSASTAAAMPVQMGVAIQAADIEDGYEPVITDTSNNEITAQFDEISTRQDTDSSILHFVATLFPGSVAGSATKTLRIQKRLGAYSASAARTVDDFDASASHDIKIKLSNVKNSAGAAVGSGSLTFAVNTYAGTAARIQKWATGPVYDAWKIDGHFTDDTGGAAITHLWGTVFVYVYTKPSDGTVYDIGVQAFVCNSPWINVASATLHTFQAALYDGATLIRNWGADTWAFASGDVNTSTNRITISGHNIGNGTALMPSTTGSLPGGLTAGTLVFSRFVSSTVIIPCTGNGSPAAAAVDLTSGGSGTHTFTRYCMMPARSMYALNGSDGKVDWLLGAGTTLRPQLTSTERTYWQDTGIIPPFDNSVTPSAQTMTQFSKWIFSYQPGTPGPISADLAAAGESEHIGFLPEFVARHWLAQDANGAQVCRTAALCWSGMPMGCVLSEDLSSGERIARIPVMINGSDGLGTQFSGLGPNRPNTWYFSSGNKSSDVVTATGTGADLGCWYESSPDASHDCIPTYDRFVMEGAPHWLWMFHLAANRNIFAYTSGTSSETHRNHTISGTTYYGKLIKYSQERGAAWAFKKLMLAAAVGGSRAEKDYFRRIVVDECLPYSAAFLTYKGTSFKDLGFWGFDNLAIGGYGFTHMFTAGVAGWCHKLYGTAASQAHADHTKKALVNLWTSLVLPSPYYGAMFWMMTLTGTSGVGTGGEGTHNVVTSLDDLYIVMTGGNFATDGTVTFPAGWGFTYTNGDRFKAGVGNPPELTRTTSYYIRDVSGLTGKLYTAASGGSPITYASAVTNVRVNVRPQFTSATGSIANRHASNPSYHNIAISAMAMLRWAGITGVDTAYSNAVARYTNPPTNFTYTTQPKYSIIWT